MCTCVCKFEHYVIDYKCTYCTIVCTCVHLYDYSICMCMGVLFQICDIMLGCVIVCNFFLWKGYTLYIIIFLSCRPPLNGAYSL